MVDLLLGGSARLRPVKHLLSIPDRSRSGERATVVWDDEAGTVDGDHSDADRPHGLRARLAEPFPIRIPAHVGPWVLRDPAHDPADFLGLLVALMPRVPWTAADLPPALRSVEPTLARVVPLPDGWFA